MTDLTLDDLDLEAIPIPARDPLVDADHEGQRVDAETGELAVSSLEHLASATAAMRQFEATVFGVLINLEVPNVVDATPEERAALVQLHAVLKDMANTLYHRAKAIEYSWQKAFEELGAKKLPLPSGKFVVYSPPATEYVVDGPTLRKELLSLVERGFLTTDEVDEAIVPVVTYKADHRHLNGLLGRGKDVAEVIESCRTRKVPAPGSSSNGKVTFPAAK